MIVINIFTMSFYFYNKIYIIIVLIAEKEITTKKTISFINYDIKNMLTFPYSILTKTEKQVWRRNLLMYTNISLQVTFQKFDHFVDEQSNDDRVTLPLYAGDLSRRWLDFYFYNKIYITIVLIVILLIYANNFPVSDLSLCCKTVIGIALFVLTQLISYNC